MNKRIKQLAEQADGQFYEGFAGSTNFVKFAEDDLQKFAELIVRECIELVEGYTKQRTHTTFYKAEEQIRQHFGVEE